jgi:TolB-like protein/Flp pilus assembly protein TadD
VAICPKSSAFVAPEIAVHSTAFQRFLSFFSENAGREVSGSREAASAGQKKQGMAQEQLPLEGCCFFTSNSMCSRAMSSELNADLKLEIGHVLFIDIVGYSKLLINEQHESLHELNQVVRNTDAFRAAEAAGKLIRLPTGDGMALAFATTPDAPVRCAMQASKALRSRPELKVRMGVHSGPVSGMTDVNDRSNVAGAGMNIAQRVMDCGDAGHILLSKRVAEDLAQYRHWQPNLHELGECEVKHGVIVSIVNLYTDEVGNSAPPEKFRGRSPRKQLGDVRLSPIPAPNTLITILFFSAVALAIGYWIFFPPAPQNPMENSVPPKSKVGAAPAKSIAVLPFENLSANQETAFFADGVQDEILTDLAKVADLKVISRTSVMQYKAARKRNLREIGQQLGVANILEGSVQQIDNRIRINAQLIDARTDTHLWAQTYDRNLADVFAIQSEISKAIAEQLQVKISESEKAAQAQARTTDLVAEKLFVQAWQLMGAASDPDAKETLLQAIRLLDEAVTRDPHFLRAYGLLTTAHLDLYWQGFDHTDARRELAHAAVTAMARSASNAGEVHLAQANYAYQGFRDYDRARAELDLARRALPNNAPIYIFTASIDRRQGRWNEAIRNFERGIDLDPRNFRYLVETAFTYQVMHRYSEASRLFERALAIVPNDHFIRTQLAELPLFESADLAPLQKELSTILNEDPKAATEIANALFDYALAIRNANGLTRALHAIRPEGLRDPYNNSLWARDWFVGLAARTFGDTDGAQTAFTAARVIEEKAVRDQPEYGPAWSRLGLIDAALGRKEEAIREGRRACEVLPLSKDALDGASYIKNLAMIYAWVGEKDLALEQLAIAAQIPASVTYGELKLYPQWDALRGDPRFDKIVESLAPKTPPANLD